MNGTRPYLRNVSLKFVSGAIGFLLSTASGIIVARALGAKGNGTAALLILFPTVIAGFTSLGISNANGYLAGARKHTPQTLVGNSLSLSMALSLLTGIAYWIALPISTRFLSDSNVSSPMLALAFLIVPVSLLEMYFSGVLLGLGRIAQLSIVSVIRFSSLLVFNIILVLVLKWGVLGVLCADITQTGICVIAYSLFLKGDVRIIPGLDRLALKDSLVFGLQAHLGTVLQFLNRRFDVFVVNFFAGAYSVGLYAVAVSLAEILWFLPNAFGYVLFPKTAASDPETARQFTPKVARLSALITAIAASGLFLVSRPLITFFYTEEFLPSLYPMWILLPGAVSVSYSQVLFSDLGGRGKPYYGTLASLIAVFVTLGGDLLLIPRFGIVGAAIASSLAYTTNAVVAIFAYLWVSGNKLTDVLLIQKDDIRACLSLGGRIVTTMKQMPGIGDHRVTRFLTLIKGILTER
jgi:O-antigen/teichoic acid export membrane protein